MSTTQDSSLRFGMKSLLLTTLNVSLFLGASMWAIRGPDMEIEDVFDAAADYLKQSSELDLALGLCVVMPAAFVAGMCAMTITMTCIGRNPYSSYDLLGLACAAAVAVAWWIVSGGESADVAARFSLPLTVAAFAMFVEVGYRKMPQPYWMLAGVGLIMSAAYVLFIVAAWAVGGKL